MPDLSSLDSNGNSAAHTSQHQQDAVWLMKTTHTNVFQAWSSKTTTAKPPTPRTVPPGPRAGLTNTVRMNTTVSARPDRFITVCIEARIRKELYHSLGQIQRAYPADKDMDAIVDECIKSWNESTWNSRVNQSLSREDISLRWSGNILPEPGTEHKKLGQFYDDHYTLRNCDVFFGNIPKTMKGLKGEVVLLEILIDAQAFEEHTGCATSVQAKGGVRGCPPKRALEKDSAVVSANSKRAHMLWDISDGAQILRATLGITEEASGTTKRVYHLELHEGDEKPRKYIAKRFFNVGKGAGMVLCEDNLEYLTLNAKHLALAARCLEEFYALADQKGAEVARDYSVTSWLLAQETIERPDGTPSSASGISKYKWKNKTTFSDWDAGVVWLLKPHRSVAVEKWSGTMLHPNCTGKWHTMMSAFAHFSFLFTEKSAVLVNLQSSYGKHTNGSPGMYGKVLFDIMTHTEAGQSGVGNHGPAGIRKFVEDHQCNALCGTGTQHTL
ncbi:uncharacterized protein TRAVEDRAFT_42510 [Trametes versicolor FP-101664 SS1]|uniref:uncharacterized protein n=1 Tax=Trametes versicolor (strain FP-101664) TaxID=717944 RepID=UPI0004622B05|nr:uncharacterized protein TRAVEDRAFT_42510 [Trametes versicolor FP-101664 SS1]EIW65126.1 hypothetical protein TRAVEDRAFT_42510 [Trametes versicolor FP-101664 SS1]